MSNRMRQGIISRTLLLKDENPKAFKKLWVQLHAQINPQTAHEELQLEKMIAATWRMQRMWAIERESIDRETAKQDPNAKPVTRTMLALDAHTKESRFQDLLHRYETRYDRQYARAYTLLMKGRARNANLPNEPSPIIEHEPPTTTLPSTFDTHDAGPARD